MTEKIIETLMRVKRVGIDSLISFLGAESDFFTAPASAANHGAFEGGLAKHSWNVYELLAEKVKRYNVPVPEETVILCGLLHDLCKVNFYIRATKWHKNDETGKWTSEQGWVIKDQLPLGHGEKSVIVVQKFVQLKDEETAMIRYHMGAFDPIVTAYPQGNAYRDAMKIWPAICLLQCADVEATFMVEALDKKA